MTVRLKATALERASPRAGELTGEGGLVAVEVLVRGTTLNHRLASDVKKLELQTIIIQFQPFLPLFLMPTA